MAKPPRLIEIAHKSVIQFRNFKSVHDPFVFEMTETVRCIGIYTAEVEKLVLITLQKFGVGAGFGELARNAFTVGTDAGALYGDTKRMSADGTFLEPVLTELDPDVGKDLTYVSKGVLGCGIFIMHFLLFAHLL